MNPNETKKNIVTWLHDAASACLRAAIDASAVAAPAVQAASLADDAATEAKKKADDKPGDQQLKAAAEAAQKAADDADEKAKTARAPADRLLANGMTLTNLCTYVVMANFADKTADFEDASSALAKDVALIQQKLGELEAAVTAVKNIVLLADATDKFVALAAGFANKL